MPVSDPVTPHNKSDRLIAVAEITSDLILVLNGGSPSANQDLVSTATKFVTGSAGSKGPSEVSVPHMSDLRACVNFLNSSAVLPLSGMSFRKTPIGLKGMLLCRQGRPPS